MFFFHSWVFYKSCIRISCLKKLKDKLSKLTRSESFLIILSCQGYRCELGTEHGESLEITLTVPLKLSLTSILAFMHVCILHPAYGKMNDY